MEHKMKSSQLQKGDKLWTLCHTLLIFTAEITFNNFLNVWLAFSRRIDKNLFWRSAYWSLWRHFEYGALLSAAEYSGGQHFNMIDKWNTEDLAKHGPRANSLFSLILIRIWQRVQSCRTLLVVQILGGFFSENALSWTLEEHLVGWAQNTWLLSGWWNLSCEYFDHESLTTCMWVSHRIYQIASTLKKKVHQVLVANATTGSWR